MVAGGKTVGVVQALYNFQINTGRGQLQVWPNAAAGVAVTSGARVFGAWTQIIAAGVIPAETYIVGVVPSDATAPTANEEYRIDLATGAAGSEVSLSSGTHTAQGLAGLALQFASAVGEYQLGEIALRQAIQVIGSPRISAAVAEFLVGGTSISLAIVTWTPNVAI